MKSQAKANAIYHALGLLFFIMPILGLGVTAGYYAFRKNVSLEEENHYRAIMNFQFSLMIFYLAILLVFPRDTALVIAVGLAVVAAMLVIYNIVLAGRGAHEATYPFALPILKPKVKTTSLDDMLMKKDE